MSAASDFANQQFKIECSEIILTRGGGSPLGLRGPGEVWQNENGQIEFKIFLNEADYQQLSLHLERPRVPGEIIGDDDCFSLQAWEYSGPVWFAESVFPSRRGGLSAGLATGSIFQLTKTTALPGTVTQGHVLVRFQGKLKLPFNQGSEVVTRVGDRQIGSSWSMNSVRHVSDPFSFDLRIEDDHTLMIVTAPSTFNLLIIASRTRESLQFVLGEEVTSLVIETRSGETETLRLYSTRISKVKGNIPSPLRNHHFDFGAHFWRMFSDYFQYVIGLAVEGWHPLSEQVGGAIESSVGSLGGEVLGLAVAVEGLAGICVRERTLDEQQNLLEDIDRALEALARLEMSQTSRNRINGSLNSMRRPRNADLLRQFIQFQRMPDALYRSWSDLRNSAAHGAGTGNRDIERILRLRI
jgi:hypothetical protein